MSAETDMRRARRIRWANAVPSQAILTAISSSAAITAVAATLVASKMAAHRWIYGVMISAVAISAAALLGSIIFLVIKTCLEYDRLTYDPATAASLLERFDALGTKRELAAQKCIESIRRGVWGGLSEAEQVEPVLDFFEDVGQHVVTNQISDELAHHHFYLWLRMYYCAAEPYIREQQKVYGIATWQHIKPLFERTFLIEKQSDATARKEPIAEEMIRFFEGE